MYNAFFPARPATGPHKENARMRIFVTKPLFAWDCLDDSPDLATVRDFLHALPDGPLLESLRRWKIGRAHV